MDVFVDWKEKDTQSEGDLTSDLVIRMTEHVMYVAQVLRGRGAEDARLGLPLRAVEDFDDMAYRIFGSRIDKSAAHNAEELWAWYYLHGFNEGQEGEGKKK